MIACVCVLDSVMSDSLAPHGCSPPDSTVHRILQARILAWVVISYCRLSSPPRNRTHVTCISCTGRWILYHCHHLGGPYIHYFDPTLIDIQHEYYHPFPNLHIKQMRLWKNWWLAQGYRVSKWQLLACSSGQSDDKVHFILMTLDGRWGYLCSDSEGWHCYNHGHLPWSPIHACFQCVHDGLLEVWDSPLNQASLPQLSP